MGQGGQEGRLASADAAARVRAFASQVGGGEDLLLALSEPSYEQGLRAALRKRRSVHLRGHDTADGEEAGTSLRISKQFQKVNSANFAFWMFSELRLYGVLRSSL